MPASVVEASVSRTPPRAGEEAGLREEAMRTILLLSEWHREAAAEVGGGIDVPPEILERLDHLRRLLGISV